MRKVTASAVILTALTGCSQSSVPSTQWSFEVPAGNQAVGVQRSSDSSFAEEISANALAGLSQSQTGAMMGPAFDQSATSADLAQSSSDSSTSALANGDISRLVTTATNPRSNTFIQATARPDPIAQARSYLSRTSRPTSVISRVPYTSQVYLPSTPAAAPLSALGAVSAPPVAPSVSSPAVAPQLISSTMGSQVSNAQAVTQRPAAAWTTLPEPTLVPPTLGASSTASPVASSAPASSSPLTATPVATYSPTEIPSLYQDVNLAEAASTDIAVVNDGLPVLAPNETVFAQAPAASSSISQIPSQIPFDSTAASTADSDVSIGTSILRELQRNANDSSAQPESQNVAQTVIAPEVASQTAIPQTAIPQAADTAVQSAESPTLARLLAGVPVRRQTSEIASFRQPTESVSAVDSAVDLEIQAVAEPIEFSEVASSPLLEGLTVDGEPAASTIYVPIPEATATDTSAAFIQAAIAALEKEASAVAFTSSELSDIGAALSVESMESTQLEAALLDIEVEEAALQEVDRQEAELQNSERLARLLSLIRSPHRVPSLAQEGLAQEDLAQEGNVLPAQTAAEDNIQANAVNQMQSAQSDRVSATITPEKQRIRKYRQRISWNNATI